MSKISTKELIVCILTIVALILAVTTDVFATAPSLNALLENANNTINEIPGNNTTENNTTENVTGNNTTENNVASNTTAVNNTAVNNTAVNNTAVNNVNRNNTVIPDTGIDYSIIFVVAIFGVSALYAYKKIRDYKNV